MPQRPTRAASRDLEPSRVDRIVAVYLVVAGAWIVLSGPAAAWVSDRTGLDLVSLETAKGLAFVTVTALALRFSLKRWATRVETAALAERDAADRLRAAERQRTTFLSGVSHELRTPLTAIVGFADTIKRLSSGREDDPTALLSERLVANADRLEALVIDLLDVDAMLRGIASVHFRRTELHHLVARVAATVDLGDRTLHLEGDPLDVDLDVPKFERTVQLLLDNVVKHAPAARWVEVRWGPLDDDVVLSVHDDGPGLPDGVLDRIFVPFVQGEPATRAPSPGLGIGLTLVAQFARLHGGDVAATNHAEGGAEIRVRVPRRQPAAVTT